MLLDAAVPHLKVQMDLYHCQIAEGDAATWLRSTCPRARGPPADRRSPERHGPDRGELHPVPVRRHRCHRLHWLDRLRIPPAAGTTQGLAGATVRSVVANPGDHIGGQETA